MFVCLQAMDELDLSSLRYGGANITGFRLVDRDKVLRTPSVRRLWTRIGAAHQRHLPPGNLLKVKVVFQWRVQRRKAVAQPGGRARPSPEIGFTRKFLAAPLS